ncbi:MAG: kelch repeat-containing protein [Deltaproteobacteria bacterium]|nr:kelch repeat-containing protein [Deltaproteobacteria bacterium]
MTLQTIPGHKRLISGGECEWAVCHSVSQFNKGYIVGGAIPNGNPGELEPKDFWEYDPATDTWTQKADIGEGGYDFGFSIGDKGYIGTGWNRDADGYGGGLTKDFWEYNPATDTWTQKADFGGGVRGGVAGFAIGNKGYIGTGGSDSALKDFWEYDPAADTWTQKTDFGGIERAYAVGFSIGNKGYIGTGWLYDPNVGSFTFTKDFWEYDPGSSITLNPVANRYSLCPHYLMIPVTIKANAVNSSGEPVTLSAKVSCNEPATLLLDWTKPLINQTRGTVSLLLRAAPSRSATERTYTITITATDAAGNTASEDVSIVVPRSCCSLLNK